MSPAAECQWHPSCIVVIRNKDGKACYLRVPTGSALSLFALLGRLSIENCPWKKRRKQLRGIFGSFNCFSSTKPFLRVVPKGQQQVGHLIGFGCCESKKKKKITEKAQDIIAGAFLDQKRSAVHCSGKTCRGVKDGNNILRSWRFETCLGDNAKHSIAVRRPLPR